MHRSHRVFLSLSLVLLCFAPHLNAMDEVRRETGPGSALIEATEESLPIQRRHIPDAPAVLVMDDFTSTPDTRESHYSIPLRYECVVTDSPEIIRTDLAMLTAEYTSCIIHMLKSSHRYEHFCKHLFQENREVDQNGTDSIKAFEKNLNLLVNDSEPILFISNAYYAATLRDEVLRGSTIDAITNALLNILITYVVPGDSTLACRRRTFLLDSCIRQLEERLRTTSLSTLNIFIEEETSDNGRRSYHLVIVQKTPATSPASFIDSERFWNDLNGIALDTETLSKLQTLAYFEVFPDEEREA